ncbi:uncharacterized protein BCR38DRAFT_441142 [Pseudomassariella vexata]|uniref:Fungal-specific transcription factor domain-domain-containing protein n=1 Tax=Pseudomassariella vexata TaxID=1141098 RepID=A0A1Y2DR71_9PEZI|nr:uncharacterized protein BCR38DRAFT_441142 [Pseudomassariella vexata]ORY61792.1 hypothetical protein BCR38DRAFT_441142 [Pseudomassariella vexata]
MAYCPQEPQRCHERHSEEKSREVDSSGEEKERIVTKTYDKVAVVFQPSRPINYLRGLSPSLEDYHVRRLFHLLYTVLWPTYPNRTFPTQDSLSCAVFHAQIADPLYLDTAVSAMATYRLRSTCDLGDVQALCTAQNRVLRSVRKALSAGQVSDVVIVSIQYLALKALDHLPHELSTRRGLFRSVGIEKLNGLDVNGHFQFADRHHSIFEGLLRGHGGIKMVHTPGIGEVMMRMLLIKASWNLERPLFDLCNSYQYVLNQELPALRPDSNEVAAFNVDDDFKEILLDLRLCCRLIEQRLHHPESTGLLLYSRDIVQHRLLSLPHERDAVEICRLAALVFTYGVTYPLPQPRPLRKATEMLSYALKRVRYTRVHATEFLLWAAVIGGIGADSWDHSGSMVANFTDKIREFRDALNVESWEDAKLVLDKFIWLDAACDEDGRLLWTWAADLSQGVRGPQISIN